MVPGRSTPTLSTAPGNKSDAPDNCAAYACLLCLCLPVLPALPALPALMPLMPLMPRALQHSLDSSGSEPRARAHPCLGGECRYLPYLGTHPARSCLLARTKPLARVMQVDLAGLPSLPQCAVGSMAAVCTEGHSAAPLYSNPQHPWKSAAFSQCTLRTGVVPGCDDGMPPDLLCL